MELNDYSTKYLPEDNRINIKQLQCLEKKDEQSGNDPLDSLPGNVRCTRVMIQRGSMLWIYEQYNNTSQGLSFHQKYMCVLFKHYNAFTTNLHANKWTDQ